MRLTAIIPAAMAAFIVLPAAAQTLDVGTLSEMDSADIKGTDGSDIGEIEDVLVDQSGTPVAVVVEVRDGLMNLGDEDVVFPLDQLTFQDGSYVTSLTQDQIGQLARYAD